jgi:hypothetical protein
LPGKATIQPSDEKQVSTKPPPPLAEVSEIACLLLYGGIFDEQTRRKPLAIATDALRYGIELEFLV